jgi:DNA-binding transcriptional regulator YiaG
MILDYSTGPSAHYPQVQVSREASSSAPSVDIAKLLDLSINKDATQLPIQKKTCMLVIVEGMPLIIKPVAEAASKAKLTQENSNTPPVTLAERLDLIKDRLALSITQMSELFGVTRKAVYDWYEGAEPRAAMINRIETLIDIINTARPEIDLQRLKAVWNIPISGRSFLMVFGDDSIGIDTLRTTLVEKLDDLSPRMVKKTNSTQKTTSQIGESRLAEFDRRADFG